MDMVCLDLEGVLIPEIWIKFAEKTGIEELRLTTRDVPDYDLLMQRRLRILADNKLGLKEIQDVVATVEPLPGAVEFMRWLRQRFQVTILSDTYYEFVMPMMAHFNYPLLLCHKLEVDAQGRVMNYVLRQKDPKREAVKAFHALKYRVLAAGDSYNDTNMLAEADAGFLFHAPANVIADFPQFPAVDTYEDLQQQFLKNSSRPG
ncbi:MAG: bifunctional phosphoserine phosphatase/homoserine phosphotransferase ThrH [Pseudomonadota bacterium]|nr:bifunctional phosphoserine phosphatase/homoserine phosphotransferase ThrH [Pseudomonadota bacterium]